MKIVIPCIALLMASGPVQAGDLLPLNDGIYVTDPRLCTIDMDDIYHAYGDGIGLYTRVLNGTTITSYESACDSSRVDAMGDHVSFRALCHGEGEEWQDDWTFKIPNKNNFIEEDGVGRSFLRCGSDLTADLNIPSTEKLLEDWHEANSECRGSSDPETLLPACGKRDAYDEILGARGWCYTQEFWSGADNVWTCAGTNLHPIELETGPWVKS